MQKHPYLPRKRIHLPRLQILQEFQQSQQSIKAFFQTMPVPLSINSMSDWRFLAANQKLFDLLEYDRASLIDHTATELRIWANLADAPELVAMVREHNWIKNLEIDLYSKTGKLIHALVSAERFWYQGRECLLISLVDMTERKRFEQGLRGSDDLINSTDEMSRTLAEVLELPQIYERLSNTVTQLMTEVTGVSISLYDPQHQMLNLVYGDRLFPISASQLVPPSYLVPVERPQPARYNAPVPRPTGRLYQTSRLRQTGRLALPAEVEMQRPVMAVSMIAKGEVLGVVQVTANAPYVFSDADAALLSWIANTAAAAIQSSRLNEKLRQTHHDLDQTLEATLNSLALAQELRDLGMEGHTKRVTEMAVQLAKHMNLNDQEIENIRRGAQLHDIGKVGIPDQILHKAGPLNEEEWATMRKHPVYAYEMLSPIPQFKDIIDIPYCHHEKWDGTGYPRRLKGKEIPLAARIFSVVDVWEALTNDRPYRTSWPLLQVLEYIRYQSGKHFDPEIADVFLAMIS